MMMLMLLAAVPLKMILVNGDECSDSINVIVTFKNFSWPFSKLYRHKVTRLIVVTSWCTQPGPNNPWWVEWIVKFLFIGAILKDMAVMEQYLEKSEPDEINYTIVRPPQLKDGKILTDCWLLIKVY